MSSLKQQRELDPGESFYNIAVAAQYDQLRKNDRFWNWEDKVLAKELSFLMPGDKVIDCPVGTGRFLNLYKELKLNVLGVDISIDMLNEAKKKIDLLNCSETVTLVNSDVNKLNLTGQSFKALVCFRLLHLISTDSVVEHVKNLASLPAETLVIQVFSVYDLSPKFMISRLEKVLLHPTLGYSVKLRYSARTIRTLLSQISSRIIKNRKQGLVTSEHEKDTFCDVTYSHVLSRLQEQFRMKGFHEADRVELIDYAHATEESAAQATMVLVLKKH